MNLVTEDKVVLSSVGCVIDKSTGITFPIHKDDTIDWDGGTHVYDIENEEWFEALGTPKKYQTIRTRLRENYRYWRNNLTPNELDKMIESAGGGEKS